MCSLDADVFVYFTWGVVTMATIAYLLLRKPRPTVDAAVIVAKMEETGVEAMQRMNKEEVLHVHCH